MTLRSGKIHVSFTYSWNKIFSETSALLSSTVFRDSLPTPLQWITAALRNRSVFQMWDNVTIHFPLWSFIILCLIKLNVFWPIIFLYDIKLPICVASATKLIREMWNIRCVFPLGQENIFGSPRQCGGYHPRMCHLQNVKVFLVSGYYFFYCINCFYITFQLIKNNGISLPHSNTIIKTKHIRDNPFRQTIQSTLCHWAGLTASTWHTKHFKSSNA